jgi:hypothetical protein
MYNSNMSCLSRFLFVGGERCRDCVRVRAARATHRVPDAAAAN